MRGILAFAWFPTQMVDGRWIWLEYYWTALRLGINGRVWWVNALDRADCVYKPPSTPPPKPR